MDLTSVPGSPRRPPITTYVVTGVVGALGSNDFIGPVLKNPLPFPSILAASRDDPYIGFDRARRLARIWKSGFVDAGWLGHVNADSGIRDWPFGQFLLRQLRAAAEPANAPLLHGRNYATLRSQANSERPATG